MRIIIKTGKDGDEHKLKKPKRWTKAHHEPPEVKARKYRPSTSKATGKITELDEKTDPTLLADVRKFREQLKDDMKTLPKGL